MNKDLHRRIEGFDNLGASFPHQRLDKLLIEYKIPDNLRINLEIAALCFVNKCLPKTVRPCLSEQDVEKALVRYEDDIPNITPNGMMVCKRNNVL